MMDVGVYRLPMAGPEDVSELEKLIDEKDINAGDIVAIVAQTEGDGYARGYSTLAFELMLSDKLNLTKKEVNDRIPMLMIGLTSGLMSPHYTVFTRKEVEAEESAEKRLSIGIKTTPVLKPEEYGTVDQAKEVAQAVKEAIEHADIESIDDVHCVEVKCPKIDAPRIEDADSRDAELYTRNMGEVAVRSKAASALGVAIALGEIKEEDLTNEAINSDWSLYSDVASVSAGEEQVACKVVVLGNSTKSVSPYKIGNSVMKDSLDIEGAKEAFKQAGLSISEELSDKDKDRIATVFINAGADAKGEIRGRRTTMHSDFLSGYAGIISKAVLNAVVGSFVGDSMILASAGSEHQGPHGASLVAAIVRTED